MGNIIIWCVFLTTVISSAKSEQNETRVFRFGRRDMFKNPEYLSYTECGVNSCTKYQAECLADGNCCLCRCASNISTYNVSEAKCQADEITLSGKTSQIRNMPEQTLSGACSEDRITTSCVYNKIKQQQTFYSRFEARPFLGN